jgi:hypothetical protein
MGASLPLDVLVWLPLVAVCGCCRSREKPFEGRCNGIAHDGKHFWALDTRGKRICAIEKASGDA